MFSRILVGVNGSERAARALAVAVDLAVAERGRLTLMAIVPHPSLWAWAGPIDPEALRRDLARYYTAMLRKAVAAVPHRVPTTMLVRRGSPVDSLLDEVDREAYDLIVVGSHDRGRLRSSLFAGVGQQLERKSHVPVLVVRAPTTNVLGEERGRRRELGLVRVNGLDRDGSAAA